MRRALLACVAALAALRPAHAGETERQMQRALIDRDRQAAEFADPRLRDMPQPSPAAPLRPDERALRAREREAYRLGLPPKPPAAPAPSTKPLPLPGGPGHAVDPVPVERGRSKSGVEGEEGGVRDVPRIHLEERP